MQEREAREREAKIAGWRKKLTAELGGRDDIAEELESHLRDGIEAMTAAGVAPDEAFERASERLGDARAVAGEFERLPTRWFGGVHSRGARALAYGSGVLSVAGFAFYLGVSVWGFARLLNGRALPADPRWAGFWQTLAVLLVVASWLAIRASHRFLERPSARDLRGVIAFNLLALWMVTVQTADSLPISYGTKVAALVVALGVVGLIWRGSVAGEQDGREVAP